MSGQSVQISGIDGSFTVVLVVVILMTSCGHLESIRDDVRAIRSAIVADTTEAQP